MNSLTVNKEVQLATFHFFEKPSHSSIFGLSYCDGKYRAKNHGFTIDGFSQTLETNKYYIERDNIRDALKEILTKLWSLNLYLHGITFPRIYWPTTKMLPGEFEKTIDQLCSILPEKGAQLDFYQTQKIKIDWALGKMKFSHENISSVAFENDLSGRLDLLSSNKSERENLDFEFNEDSRRIFAQEYISDLQSSY